MENKYVILRGRLSGPQGPVCAQGLYIGAWDGDLGSS